jgi:hypothetical protein
MTAALKYRQSNLPRQKGELARLKIVQGPDYGSVFVVGSERAKIGRGDDNDIVLADLKASRHHAELILAREGWMLKDLGSANGILHNGKFVRSVVLNSGEVVSIGETTLEFVTSQAGTMILMAPPKSAAVVHQEQANFLAKKAEVHNLAKIGGGKGQPRGAPGQAKSGGFKSFLLLVGAAVILVSLFLGDDKRPAPKPPAKKGGGDEAKDLALKPPPPIDNAQISKSAETFFRAGFREYTSGNYIRALTQFETVLQIAPGHQLATLYRDNCNREIAAEVKFHLERGKRSHEAGKLKEARGHYESVMRLLFKDTGSDDYKEAKTGLESVQKEIREGGDS